MTDDPIILSPTDDLTPLTDVLIEASSVKVIVLGFTIGIKANVTKALINGKSFKVKFETKRLILYFCRTCDRKKHCDYYTRQRGQCS